MPNKMRQPKKTRAGYARVFCVYLLSMYIPSAR